MPLSDHVANDELRGSDKHAMYGDVNGSNKNKAFKFKGKVEGRRKGIPMDVNDGSSSLLSPILSHLPSLSGIQSIRGLLPSSPIKSTGSQAEPPVYASWETADLQDGMGKTPLLLLSSHHHPLQIYRYTQSVLPDDDHVKEDFPAPEEVFNLPSIRYDDQTEKLSLDHGELSSGEGHVIQARSMTDGPLPREHGPLVALLTSSPRRKSTLPIMSLVIVSLRTGTAIKSLSLGPAKSASVAISNHAVVVSVSHPSPSIHLLHPATLIPLCSPIASLSTHSDSTPPVFALSGRLLAYATSTPPARPGSEGLGTVVTSNTTSRSPKSYSDTTSLSPMQMRPASDGSQGALLSSAVGIGGGVARGVWAGIKMGARAANQARNSRLARSAPADPGTLADDEDGTESVGTESRSLGESSVLDESIPAPLQGSAGSHGGEWIQIVDIRPRPAHRPSPTRHGRKTSSAASPDKPPVMLESSTTPRNIAHFRSPPSRSVAPLPADGQGSYGRPPPQSRAISYLAFNSQGTQLLAAPEDGRVAHVFEIHPSGATVREASEVTGQVWHLYELRRGNTAGSVCDVQWSKDGRWVGVGTGKGTIHMYPINTTGGVPSASSHASVHNTNPQQLHPLSTIVSAAARLRPVRRDCTSETAPLVPDGPGLFTIHAARLDPLHSGTYLQDVAIFRSGDVNMEVSRLALKKAAPPPAQAIPGQRRASALTEMMRNKAGFGEGSDLEVVKAVKARWALPLGRGEKEPVVAVDVPGSAVKSVASGVPSLARAEISTYCIHPRILPGTIYLSRQMDFFAARPIDDFSPLSIMDVEARVKRVSFRPEVEARPISPDIKSFDEPLLSALHSVIESPSSSLIPGLPNGYPASPRWKSIPIRSVAQGLGEGVDRVRREYVRAQHTRAKRRASQPSQIGLSFEDETVFAHMALEDDDASSPSSAALPATNTESSGEGEVVGEVGGEDEDDWGEGWEAEYAKAVEDDGAPEELVLGLMDEEEEERRTWAMKQKQKQKYK